MIVKFNINLEAWVEDLEVYGKDLEEAKEGLSKMTIEQLLEDGYVKQFEIKEIDYEFAEKEYTIQTYNIKYDVEEEIEEDLPKELVLKVTCNPKDLEDEIWSEIQFKTGYSIRGFDYKILEEL